MYGYNNNNYYQHTGYPHQMSHPTFVPRNTGYTYPVHSNQVYNTPAYSAYNTHPYGYHQTIGNRLDQFINKVTHPGRHGHHY